VIWLTALDERIVIMASMTHIMMRRPHLFNIPEIPPLPEGYILRAFKDESNLASLASTLSAAFNEPWSEERVRHKLTEASDVKAVYTVTWKGKIVATASSRWLLERFPVSGYVHWVGTHPDHTRRGLSSALMAQLLYDFIDRGYKDAVLETDDFRIPAIRTYLKFGFIPVYELSGEDHRYRWSAIFQVIFGR
jgi:mycothiol synthase